MAAELVRTFASHLPGPLIEAGRWTRTLGLRAASPLEALVRRLRGCRPLPPLWLRRHAGRIADFERPNPPWIALLEAHGALASDGLVLDVGCGPGALAIALEERLGAGARYVGFDVHEPSVAWCRRRFARDPRYLFELASIRSPYASGPGVPLADYRFPAADGTADAVLARSVFTHLLPEEARHYLEEVRRVLAPGGRAFLSAFLFDGRGDPAGVPAFPFPSEAADVRWRVRSRPHAGIAFRHDTFLSTVAGCGLRVVEMRPGFHPGAAAALTGQDLLVLARDGAPVR